MVMGKKHCSMTLVLVFTGMTSAFLSESCQGDQTQGQQSVVKILKSARLAPKTYATKNKYYRSNFSENKQTRERGGFAEGLLICHSSTSSVLKAAVVRQGKAK